MLIGIPKETKIGETRVSLMPEHIGILIADGHEVWVEKDAGIGAGFTNEEYKKYGAKVVDANQIYDCKMIVRVKNPEDFSTLRYGQIVIGNLYVSKGYDDTSTLDEVTKKKITTYVFRLMKDNSGRSLMNFSYEAGVVGAYEGIRLWASLQEKRKVEAYMALPSSWYLQSTKKIVQTLKDTVIGKNSAFPSKVLIIGSGKVATACMHIFNHAGIAYFVITRKESMFISEFLPSADVIVNAASQPPNFPNHIIARPMLKLIKKTTPIVDIACDVSGVVETCKATTWDKPTYLIDGITHFCVPNLPSAVAHEATLKVSTLILPYVRKIALGEYDQPGLVTMNGVYVYKGIY